MVDGTRMDAVLANRCTCLLMQDYRFDWEACAGMDHIDHVYIRATIDAQRLDSTYCIAIQPVVLSMPGTTDYTLEQRRPHNDKCTSTVNQVCTEYETEYEQHIANMCIDEAHYT